MQAHARILAACLAALLVTPALADVLILDDGSRLHGELTLLRDGQMHLVTDFAGELTIERKRLESLQTDDAMLLRTQGGDDLLARPVIMDEGRQEFETAQAGPANITFADIVDIRAPGALGPQAQARADKQAERAERERELQAMLWSGRIEAGVQGSSGNSQNRSSDVRVMIRRERPNNRWIADYELHRASQNDEQTEDEDRASLRYEQDFSERAFAFAQIEAERDEFEDVDLRYRITVGPGYFLLQQPDHELKLRVGGGFEQERFEDSENNNSFVATAGYDYRIDLWRWLRLTHEFTYLPEVDDTPSENYRLESVLGAELPLGSLDSAWRLRGEWRHDYDNNPKPGVATTDSTYTLGIARDFK